MKYEITVTELDDGRVRLDLGSASQDGDGRSRISSVALTREDARAVAVALILATKEDKTPLPRRTGIRKLRTITEIN